MYRYDVMCYKWLGVNGFFSCSSSLKTHLPVYLCLHPFLLFAVK